MKSKQSNYRERIYHHYASNIQDMPDALNEADARRWGRAYRYYLRQWLPKKHSAKIVDLACGSGKLLLLFRDSGYRDITGVDISPEQVILAKQVISTVEEANILDWLESHPNEFDLITGFDIIEHLYKQEVFPFLDACHTALKPKGRLILQTPNADSLWGAQLRYGDFTHEVGFTPNALTRLLHIAGYQNIRSSETGPIPLRYSVRSSIRYLIWRVIRTGLKAWNLAETGHSGSGIFTRVFLITGEKVSTGGGAPTQTELS